MSQVSGKRGARSKTTTAWIVDELRQEIVSRKIAAGDRLTVTDLANRYGVSGAPVREALVQLGTEGYIEVQPNKGAIARVFGATELRQIFGVREALESHQARRFATVVTDEEADRMQALAEEFLKLVQQGKTRRSSAANIQFHDIIINHDGNSELINILERHRGVALMMRQDFGRSESRAHQAAAEHFEIIEAMRRRDPDQAAALIAAHVRGTLNDILERCEAAAAEKSARS